MGRDCWWNRNASTRVIQFGAPWKWTHKNTIVQSKKLAEGGCCRVKWSGWEGWRTRRMFANDMARLGGKHVNNNNIARTLIRLMLSTYALATAIDSVYTTGFSLHPREALPTWRAASKETWWWWRKVCDQRPPGLPTTTTTTTTAALHIFSTKVTLRDPRHSAGHHDSCVPWRRFLYIREKKKRKKSFAGPEVSRHLGNPLAADGKIVTTFFLAHKVFFFATGPIKLVLSSTKLVSAGLLGSFRLSDAEGIQTVGGFSLSLSLEFLFYSTQVLIRRARSTRLMLQLTDDQYRRPPTPRCTNISSLFMYVGPLSLAPIVFSYPSTDWLCAPFRRNRCPSFTPFQRPLLSLFDLVDSFCWDSMASASIVYSGAASALCKC